MQSACWYGAPIRDEEVEEEEGGRSGSLVLVLVLVRVHELRELITENTQECKSNG